MTEQMPTQAINFDKATVFYNLNSTNAKATLDYVQHRLERTNGRIPIHYAQTSPDPEEMVEIYANNIDPGANTMVGVVGGDWSINRVNKARSTLAEDYANTALWAIAGGSSGNFLKSTIDRYYLSKPDLVLELGRIISFRTMNIDIVTPAGDRITEEAITTIGFNGTHHMIDPVNSESHRASKIRNLHIGRRAIGQWIADPPVILNGLIKAPVSFDYLNEVGEKNSVFEILFINTPRVASLIRAREVSLSGPGHRIDIPRKQDLPLTLASVNLGESPGKDLLEPAVFRPLVDVAYQVDGDSRQNGKPLIAEAGSIVTIYQSEQPIGILQLERAA